ncbi:MAG TPA: hypothetical protein VJ912_01455 [Candidatus Nanoarchaeia archaeon]|nr:hypothetical protein [Candidatus Nanoarchaeia archaeon]
MPNKTNKKHKYKLINQETGKVISYFRMKTAAVQEQKRLKKEFFGLKTKLEVLKD